jgi:hypothetical protein
MFHMLTQTRLRGKAAKAAALAASILHEKTIPMLIVEDERIGIGFSFEGGRGERIFARENRGWKIAREAPGLIANAEGYDRVWLEASARALDVALNALAIGDMGLLRDALNMLDRLGWREPLARLFAAQFEIEN